MSLLSKRGLALACVLSAWTVPAAAEEDAATRAAARKLAEDGVAALQNGDASTAAQKLEKAHQVLRVSSVALWSARALVKQGLLVEAAERLLEATRLTASGDAAVQAQARADAEKELSELKLRIPNLVITVAGASDSEVTVSLDGKEIPSALLGEDRPINPGRHTIVGRRGAEEQSASVTVVESDRKQVTLRFAARSAVSPTASGSGSRRTLAIVGFALGGVGLAVGTVFGLGARSTWNDAKSTRDNTLAKEAGTKADLSTIGFVVGGAGLAAGSVLWLTAPTAAEVPTHGSRWRITPVLSPSALGIVGSTRY